MDEEERQALLYRSWPYRPAKRPVYRRLLIIGIICDSILFVLILAALLTSASSSITISNAIASFSLVLTIVIALYVAYLYRLDRAAGSPMNRVLTMHSLFTAWNHGSVEGVLGFFSRDAIVNLEIPRDRYPYEKPPTYQGKEYIERFVRRHIRPSGINDLEIEAANFRAEENLVVWDTVVIIGEIPGQEAHSRIEGTAWAIFAGSKIVFLNFTADQ